MGGKKRQDYSSDRLTLIIKKNPRLNLFLWILPSEVPCGVFYVTKQRLHLNSALAPKTHPQVGESSRSAKCVECIKMFAKSIFFSWKGTRAVFPAHYPRYHGSVIIVIYYNRVTNRCAHFSNKQETSTYSGFVDDFHERYVSRNRAATTSVWHLWSLEHHLEGDGSAGVTLLLTIIHTFPWKAPAVLVESYYYSYYLLFFCPSFHLRRF